MEALLNFKCNLFFFHHTKRRHNCLNCIIFFVFLKKGESASKWSTKPFQMFKNGSYWQPPPLNRYTQGSSDDAYDRAKQEVEIKKNNLTNEYLLYFVEIDLH